MTEKRNEHKDHEHGKGGDHRPPNVPPPEPPGKIIHPRPTHGAM